MWLHLFVIAVFLNSCSGDGFWWWYTPPTSKWCSTEFDCNFNGHTFVNSRCILNPGAYYKHLRTSQIKIKETIKLDDKMRKDILMLYNTQRNLVAGGSKSPTPKASNMRQMTWDYELEEFASILAHYSCAQRVTNLLLSIDGGVCRKTQHFQEVSFYRNGLVTETPIETSAAEYFVHLFNMTLKSSDVANLTDDPQLSFLGKALWAESYKIGCTDLYGLSDPVETPTDKSPAYHYRWFICYYGPGGGIVGEKIYKEGDKCKACPKGSSCRADSVYPNLCALDSDPKNYDLGGEAGQRGTPFLVLILSVAFTAKYIENT